MHNYVTYANDEGHKKCSQQTPHAAHGSPVRAVGIWALLALALLWFRAVSCTRYVLSVVSVLLGCGRWCTRDSTIVHIAVHHRHGYALTLLNAIFLWFWIVFPPTSHWNNWHMLDGRDSIFSCDEDFRFYSKIIFFETSSFSPTDCPQGICPHWLATLIKPEMKPSLHEAVNRLFYVSH